MSLEFLLWVAQWRKQKRNDILEKLSKIEKEKVHIFKSRRQLNKWYKEKFNKKIIID